MFSDLPTIEDEKDEDMQQEFVSLEEESRRQNGILHDINNFDRMLELGQMAVNNPIEFQKLMALPTFLQNVQKTKLSNCEINIY